MNWHNFTGSLSNLYWAAIAFLLLQPVIRQRMLDWARQTMMRNIELKRQSRVISLIHRKEIVNIFGFPLVQYVDIQDSEAILRAIHLTSAEVPLDLILHTPAGLSFSAEQIARALNRHKGKVTVFVPHYAMSGGTLIALAADELVMSPDAVLGALDPTIGRFPAASVLTVSQRKKPEDIDDETFLLVDQAGKAVAQMKQLVALLLRRHRSGEKADELAHLLTSGRWTQDYPITIEEAVELGLAVREEMPVEIFQYMNLFPQSGQQRPSVDFIPLPYQPTKTK